MLRNVLSISRMLGLTLSLCLGVIYADTPVDCGQFGPQAADVCEAYCIEQDCPSRVRTSMTQLFAVPMAQMMACDELYESFFSFNIGPLPCLVDVCPCWDLIGLQYVLLTDGDVGTNAAYCEQDGVMAILSKTAQLYVDTQSDHEVCVTTLGMPRNITAGQATACTVVLSALISAAEASNITYTNQPYVCNIFST